MRSPSPAAAALTGMPPGDDPADEELMLAFGRGDVAAFESLYARHERPVYRFLLRSVSIPALAEDILQDTWLAAARGAATYQPTAKFTTWLYKIARTRLVDHWRARDPAILQGLGEQEAHDFAALAADISYEPERIAMDRAKAREFVMAVEALPPAQREVFLLHADAGLSIQEIADVTGVPPETTKSRYRYACAKLRDSMQDWRNP
jgi:RNA polymerase sigma-70 factor (ECF subfamily)